MANINERLKSSYDGNGRGGEIVNATTSRNGVTKSNRCN